MTTEKATFAGGCFWCMVKPFDSYDGIESVVSGYTGGHVPNPTYEQVCSETTGHYEAVQITFQPEVFPYEKLLDVFWSQIDPTDAGGQFMPLPSSTATHCVSAGSACAAGALTAASDITGGEVSASTISV